MTTLPLYCLTIYLCLGVLLSTVVCGQFFIKERKRGSTPKIVPFLGMAAIILFGWPLIIAMFLIQED